jgi:hypothetical protein
MAEYQQITAFPGIVGTEGYFSYYLFIAPPFYSLVNRCSSG